MDRTGFSCRMCGHCCLNLVDAYRGCVSDADLELWKRAGREDLLAWVQTLDLGRGNLLHLAWQDPATGEEVDRCPWLVEAEEKGLFLCGINDIKPEHCRNYPEHPAHGRQCGCPGFDLPCPDPVLPPDEKG